MKITIIPLISISLLIMSCQPNQCNCKIEDELKIENDSLINSMLNQPENWFESYWDRFDEPILMEQGKESYRLAITVLLADYFKLYRIESENRKYNLHIKEYAVSTTTRHREDSLVSSFTKEISKNDWLNITNSIKENCYWTMAVDIKEDDGWLDGSGWTLEGFNQNNNCSNSDYHIIYRHSPYGTNDTSNFIKICEKFMELDSLNIKEF